MTNKVSYKAQQLCKKLDSFFSVELPHSVEIPQEEEKPQEG